jgi:hypothetical protein
MNTKKVFAYGISAVLIALAFIACPEPDPTHTHSYSTEWSHNATQHWHECTANDGAKTAVANHTGDPGTVCSYTVPVAPVAHAQAEPTHTLANDLAITLNGTDSAGNITAYAWQCESYTADQGAVSAEYTPAQVNALIANATAPTTTVAPRKAGTYVFKLTITDNDGGSDTDTVTVVVEVMTHTITVPVITTVANPLNFGEVSALSGWNSDFASVDVTYILTLDNVDQSVGTTSIAATGLSNETHTVTQTFYYKGNPIPSGSRSVDVLVFFNAFASMTGTLTELTLLLSKTEIPPGTRNGGSYHKTVVSHYA